MEKFDIEMNKRLKFLREKLKLNQGEMAEKLGFGQSYLSEVEREKKEVTTRIIKSLIEIFQVSAEWIINGKGEIFSKKSNNNGVVNKENDLPFAGVEDKTKPLSTTEAGNLEKVQNLEIWKIFKRHQNTDITELKLLISAYTGYAVKDLKPLEEYPLEYLIYLNLDKKEIEWKIRYLLQRIDFLLSISNSIIKTIKNERLLDLNNDFTNAEEYHYKTWIKRFSLGEWDSDNDFEEPLYKKTGNKRVDKVLFYMLLIDEYERISNAVIDDCYKFNFVVSNTLIDRRLSTN
jgi:transcriptional regulator with XRE-family HTH domain